MGELLPEVYAIAAVRHFEDAEELAARARFGAVASFGLAERGYNVLVVDLDLEAPGLGGIFLGRRQLPKFGTLDYFVESTLGDLDKGFVENLIAVSPLEETSFNFDYDEEIAPHFAWPILNDANYFEFNPLARPDQFTKGLYERTFGPFIDALADRLGLNKKR